MELPISIDLKNDLSHCTMLYFAVLRLEISPKNPDRIWTFVECC